MITIITIALLVIIEFCLRIFFPGEMKEIHSNQERIRNFAYEHHPDYAITLKPNISKTFVRDDVNGGDVINWSTNELSFRGGPLHDNPDLRVVVYGDSNVHARFSQLENTYPARLQHYLGEDNAQGVEVINAGVVGFGPDQSLLRLTHELKAIKPDIVILHVYADNDFGDLVRNRLFDIGEDGKLTRLDTRRGLDPHLTGPRFMMEKAALAVRVRLGNWLNRNERKPETQLEELLVASAAEWNAYQTSEVAQFSHFADHYDIDLALYPDQPSSRRKVDLMKGVLARAKTALAESDAELLVLIQPSARDTSTNRMPNYTEFEKYPQYRRDRLSTIVEEICEELGIPNLNLFDTFMQRGPAKLFFRETDNHWNDDGQDLAALETAKYIHEHFGAGVPK